MYIYWLCNRVQGHLNIQSWEIQRNWLWSHQAREPRRSCTGRDVARGGITELPPCNLPKWFSNSQWHLFLDKPLTKKSSTPILRSLQKCLMMFMSWSSVAPSTKYLAKNFYSLADLHHFPCTYYFMTSPWASLVNEWPRVKAWWEDISSRPASKKVAEGTVLGDKWILIFELSISKEYS